MVYCMMYTALSLLAKSAYSSFLRTALFTLPAAFFLFMVFKKWRKREK